MYKVYRYMTYEDIGDYCSPLLIASLDDAMLNKARKLLAKELQSSKGKELLNNLFFVIVDNEACRCTSTYYELLVGDMSKLTTRIEWIL